jgi:hypothetical protein
MQAAAVLGWSQPNVAYYCRQAKPPRPHVLAHIARTLQIDEAELQRAESHALQVKIAEPPATPYPTDPWPAWARSLRAAYRRDPARIELALRTAWPREADAILAWLRRES